MSKLQFIEILALERTPALLQVSTVLDFVARRDDGIAVTPCNTRARSKHKTERT